MQIKNNGIVPMCEVRVKLGEAGAVKLDGIFCLDFLIPVFYCSDK